MKFDSTDIDGCNAVDVTVDDACRTSLIGERGGAAAVVTGIDGRAAGQQCMREDGTTVVAKRTQERIDGRGVRPHQVAVLAVRKPGGTGTVADEIVAQRGEGSRYVVATYAGRITSDNCVLHAGGAVISDAATCTGQCLIGGDGAAGDCESTCNRVGNSTTVAVGSIR